MSNEAGQGGDSAVLTIVEGGADLEETSVAETGIEEMTEENPELTAEDYAKAAMNIAGAIGRAMQQGEPVDAVLCNPELKDGLEAAFRALPDEVMPEAFRSQLPFDANPQVPDVKLLTRSDIEASFLFDYFSDPKEQRGGNGLIPRMQAGLHAANSPVRIDLNFLRMIYLMEMKERCDPRVVVPQGARLHQGLLTR